jgi:hypothetical protein
VRAALRLTSGSNSVSVRICGSRPASESAASRLCSALPAISCRRLGFQAQEFDHELCHGASWPSQRSASGSARPNSLGRQIGGGAWMPDETELRHTMARAARSQCILGGIRSATGVVSVRAAATALLTARIVIPHAARVDFGVAVPPRSVQALRRLRSPTRLPLSMTPSGCCVCHAGLVPMALTR